VLSSELSEARLWRRIFAVARSWTVWLRRAVVVVSRAASWSGVKEVEGSWMAW
jgi:hypothetical protein